MVAEPHGGGVPKIRSKIGLIVSRLSKVSLTSKTMIGRLVTKKPFVRGGRMGSQRTNSTVPVSQGWLAEPDRIPSDRLTVTIPLRPPKLRLLRLSLRGAGAGKPECAGGRDLLSSGVWRTMNAG
jgi:hypothetical protein